MKTTYKAPELLLLNIATTDVIAASALSLGDDPNAALDEVSLGGMFSA